jgi:hypothetical protein
MFLPSRNHYTPSFGFETKYILLWQNWLLILWLPRGNLWIRFVFCNHVGLHIWVTRGREKERNKKSTEETKKESLVFSLFIPAVFFRCFRKYCRFQSIHSQFYVSIYLLYVTRTTCFGLSYFRPSSGPSITLLLAMPGVMWLFYLAIIPFNIIMF